MNSGKHGFWTHTAGLFLTAVLILVAGWMFYDAWVAFTQPIVIIEWQTASEMNTLGFNIYRSELPNNAQEVKINTDLIPPAVDPIVGGAYAFKDEGVQPGITYYYSLEEVDGNGMVSRFQMEPVTALRGGWQQGLLGVVLLVAAGFVLTSGSRAQSVEGQTK